MTDIATPDYAAIKTRQQATWASGDYHMIGTQIVIVSELLIEALDVHSTERVLDVATGSGNAAMAAARRGCAAVGIDYVPASWTAPGSVPRPMASRSNSSRVMPRTCRSRTAASTSSAPCSGRCSRRIRSRPRVSSRGSPGPVAASASWPTRRTASSGISSRRSPSTSHPRRTALADPVGYRGAPQELFGDRSPTSPSPSGSTCSATASPQAFVDYWRRFYGPTLKAFEAVGDDGRAALEADLLDLIGRFNRADDGTMIVPNEYLEAVIVKQ